MFVFTLLLSATRCAASLAMAFATVFGTGAPWGCGRILLGDGDLLPWSGPWKLGAGGSSVCPWTGDAERVCSHDSSIFKCGPKCSSLVSGAPALANGLDLGAVLVWGVGGTSKSDGMAATEESTDSPCAESVRTVTSFASKLLSLINSTSVLSAVGKITSATWVHKQTTY